MRDGWMMGSTVDRESENGSGRAERPESVRVMVDPGICGFGCTILAWKEGKEVKFDIQSECGQIKKLAAELGPVQMKDLFVPLTKSPIFLCAEKSRCHLACPIPSALVKTAEVVLGLALRKEVSIRFLT
jgi:hypothetical protein